MVEAERLAAAVSLGVHGRRKAGMGESFWQFRRYRAEDPSIAIDWRQSAKSTHLYVREREWEAAQGVWFWRDGSAGMRFGTGGVQKVDRASVLAIALANLLVRGGERVALYGEGRAPQSSRLAVRRIAHAMSEKDDSAALPPDAPITKNGQIVWLSDFLSPLEDLEAAMARLARHGVQGHLVHIVDPQEEDFPFRGRTRFDAPGQPQSETIGRAENVGEAYRARFKAHAETVAAIARKQRWSYLMHRTDRSAMTTLIAMVAEMSGGV
jgi:uncharacterized protein (DUF58 family)